MKKGRKRVLILLCLLFPGMMGIQGQGVLRKAPIDGYENIMRYDFTSGNHIVCSHPGDGTDVHFAMTDMNFIIDVFVATGLTVKDFEIIDRLVFFCGYTSTNSGFLGWFDIDSLFYLGGSAHIDRTLSLLGLKSLDDIELYHDLRGGIRIAGYGSDHGASAIYRAFEAVGSTVSSMQYRVLEFDIINNSKIVDIEVTDNYVVFMEQLRANRCNLPFGYGVSFHIFPKYNMFGLAPFTYYYFETSDDATTSYYYLTPQGNYQLVTYVYPLNDDPYYFTPPAMTHYEGDKIAVCSYRRDFLFTQIFPPQLHPCGGNLTHTNTYLAFRTYDLTPMLSSNPILMTSASLAQLYSGNCDTIDGFEYDTLSEHFVVLHRHESSAGIVEHAFTTIDFTTGVPPAVVNSYYQTGFNTITQWMPCNMCIIPNKRFTVSGYNLVNKDYLFWQNCINPDQLNDCERMALYPVQNIPTMISKEEYNFNEPTVWTPLLFIMENDLERIEEECIIICD